MSDSEDIEIGKGQGPINRVVFNPPKEVPSPRQLPEEMTEVRQRRKNNSKEELTPERKEEKRRVLREWVRWVIGMMAGTLTIGIGQLFSTFLEDVTGNRNFTCKIMVQKDNVTLI